MVSRHNLFCPLAKRGREINQIVDQSTVAAVGLGLGRYRLRRRIGLARDVSDFHRHLRHRPDRFSGHAIEYVEEPLLGRLRDSLYRLPVNGNISKNRRRGDIHVPERVMNQLEMPLALAGFQVHAHQAFAEQIVSRTVPP